MTSTWLLGFRAQDMPLNKYELISARPVALLNVTRALEKGGRGWWGGGEAKGAPKLAHEGRQPSTPGFPHPPLVTGVVVQAHGAHTQVDPLLVLRLPLGQLAAFVKGQGLIPQ